MFDLTNLVFITSSSPPPPPPPHFRKQCQYIGFMPDRISMVLELLSAILNLCNVQFESCRLAGSEACRI